MKKTIMLLTLLVFVCGMAVTAQAILVDHGPNGEYFYDTSTGLYWYDPAQFVGKTKADIDAFVSSNKNWKYATAFEVEALLGKTSGNGTPLNQIMGEQQFDTSLIVNGVTQRGHRWIGYFDRSAGVPPGTVGDPDGWLAQTVLEPVADLSKIGDTGFQNGVEDWKHGAWINSRINPVEELTCTSVHQTARYFTTANSQKVAGISWHKDLGAAHVLTWIFVLDKTVNSHKIQFEFMEHVMRKEPNVDPINWSSKSAAETCQEPGCAPTLYISYAHPDGQFQTLNAVRQPGLESLNQGIVALDAQPTSSVYFLDEDRTTVTVLVPRDSAGNITIPAGSAIFVYLIVPALNEECEKMCGGSYILGSKQRSCQMSYLNCELQRPGQVE